MTQPPVLTFETQKIFWAMLREYRESAVDVALHPPTSPEKGRERARRRYEKARDDLATFVESISETPGKVKRGEG